MRTEIVQEWDNYAKFTMELNDEIKSTEQYYEIIDIKYSTFYEVVNKQWNYSALIIYKDKESDE